MMHRVKVIGLVALLGLGVSPAWICAAEGNPSKRAGAERAGGVALNSILSCESERFLRAEPEVQRSELEAASPALDCEVEHQGGDRVTCQTVARISQFGGRLMQLDLSRTYGHYGVDLELELDAETLRNNVERSLGVRFRPTEDRFTAERGGANPRRYSISRGIETSSFACSLPPPTEEETEIPTSGASEPSFDCSRASTAVERMVCSTPELSQLDWHLGSYYAVAMASFGHVGSLAAECMRKDQREWLRTTRNRCDTQTCLKVAYLRRLAELNGLQAGASAVRYFALPSRPSLSFILPPEQLSTERGPSRPLEVEGRLEFDTDYMTLVADGGVRYILGLLNFMIVPPGLSREEGATLRVRGKAMDRKPHSTAHFGIFDSRECIYLYRP